MVYNKDIDARVKSIVSRWKNTDDKKMFGGVCHLMNGNMLCGVLEDFLILRLGPEGAEVALEKPFVKPFDVTGRPMRGWVMVASSGFETDEELLSWLEQAKEFVSGLPSKSSP